MKVALACDWFLPRMGGIELHLRDLALALRARGVDARIVTTTPGDEQVDGIPVHRVPAALAPGASFAVSPRLFGRVRALIAREEFDIVHAHASVVSPVAYAAALGAARLRLPSVLTFHSMLHRTSALLGMSEGLFGWSRGRIVLSAVSSVVATQAARWIPEADVGVLPNGVDTTFWRAGPPHTNEAEIVFVTAMRLSRKKRPLALIDAFAALTRFVAGAPALRLIIAGEGPERPAMLRRAAELGIAATVQLVGQLERPALRELYGRAHVFVLPSERESFGIAALEARTAGLPVVAMRASGARDFIVHGVNGLLASDDAELVRQMTRLAIDQPFRRYLAARNSASPPPYDWRDVAELHLQLYATAAALRNGSEPASQR